jgi:NADH-quinone oxidoreductase subunit E
MNATKPIVEVDPRRVDAIIQKYRADESFAIEMLLDVQESFRHLPQAALERISRATGADLARLYHIATFYKAFSLEPRGELAVQVCTGTACHVRGAPRVLEALERELGISAGGTTADLCFSLEAVRCVGCCSLAPVVTVGRDLCGEVSSAEVGRLLKRYRKSTRKSTKKSAKKEAQDA